jgi:hypothetical protein
MCELMDRNNVIATNALEESCPSLRDGFLKDATICSGLA